MKNLNIGTLSFWVVILLITGCSKQQENKEPRNLTYGKYSLQECVVQVNLNWEDDIGSAEKYEAIKNIGHQIVLAMNSREFPLFGSNTTRSMNYYLFYYADKCEKRERYTESIINDFILNKVTNFPPYKILTKPIKFENGAEPRGWWK